MTYVPTRNVFVAMAAAVNAGRGARVWCNPSGINKVAYPIDSTWRAFCAHSSPERACAATTPNRNGRAVLGNGRVLGLVCRRSRRRRAVRVIVIVPATVSPGAASPRAPREQPEDEEPDQQDPEQAEEGEEAEPASVITRVDEPTVSARCRHDLGRLARVIGNQPDDRRNRRRDESPNPEKTEPSIHA